MLTPAQSRAGRGLLSWSQQELATAASVGLSTVRDLETGRRAVSAEMLDAIRNALESAGVDFIEENGGGVGARLARPASKRRAAKSKT
jgi:transcriptional regulator with XRE-family HTH domain